MPGLLGLLGRTASLGRLGLLVALAPRVPCTHTASLGLADWLLGCLAAWLRADWLGTLTSALLLLPDSRAHRMGGLGVPWGPWGPNHWPEQRT
jgi:hypothetical protein